MLVLKILVLILPLILLAKCDEYSMIEEVQDDYSNLKMPQMDMKDVYQTFYSQAHETEIRPMVKQGKQLTKAPYNCRSLFHNTYGKASGFVKKIHEYSKIQYKACNKLVEMYKLPREDAYKYLSQITAPKEFCPYSAPIKCDRHSTYRSYDGSCNNLLNPYYGMAQTPMRRMKHPRYDDYMAQPVHKTYGGKNMTNSRVIAFTVHHPNDRVIESNLLSVYFGQFLDHDLSHTGLIPGEDGRPKACPCGTDDEDCINIDTPENDPIYSGMQKCQTTARSVGIHTGIDCKLGYRNQINLLTHFIDMSQIYGSKEEDAMRIREMRNGLLKVSFLNKQKYEHLPLSPVGKGTCTSEKDGFRCFDGPELRINQNLGLISMHTVFLREHNRIARSLKRINFHWDDEKLYQESRRIMIAVYQHIIYNEWVDKIVGKKIAQAYDLYPKKSGYFYKYDANQNPAITNEFATAAFRYGHSLITSSVIKSSVGLEIIGNISLTKSILKTNEAYSNGGIDSVLRGLLVHRATAPDNHLTETLNNHLFENLDEKAETHYFSLSSLNIQRGKDHALHSYAHYRSMWSSKMVNGYDDMHNMKPHIYEMFKKVYESPMEIDLFTGGISENSIEGGVVGHTFAHIIAKQFRELKIGDRFWYENGHEKHIRFTSEQLREIRKASMSRILCDNMDLEYLPMNSWLMASKENPYVPCSSLPYLNLKYWADN